MRRYSSSRRYEYAGEGFDSRNPTAKALRQIAGGDIEMRPEARRQMMERLLSYQRSHLMGGPRRLRRLGRLVLIPAVAATVALVLFIAIFFSGGGKPVQPKVFASLASCTGSIELRGASGFWRAARKGDRLGVGCGLRSGADSFASVVFPEGSTMRVTDGSEAFVDGLGSRSVTVRHVSGGTYHRVQKGSSYTVLNGDIAMRALGTAFNVDNRSPGSLEIVTVESAVEVDVSGHKPMKIPQGEVMVVDTTAEKKAEVQPVSRERLEEDRLYESAKQDAESGNTPAVYEQLDVPLQSAPPPKESATTPPPPDLSIGLEGTAAETGVSLEWGVSGTAPYDALALLKSEMTQPVVPDNEIASYSDTSIGTAMDNNVIANHTYQYRVAALKDGEVVTYSNTIVLTVPEPEPKPPPASVSLVSSVSTDGVKLEWSVSGATRFDGFVVERVVTKAPQGSPTPAGASSVERIQDNAVLYTYPDTTVLPGHTYTYKVGLLVDGSVMTNSNHVTVEVPLPLN